MQNSLHWKRFCVSTKTLPPQLHERASHAPTQRGNIVYASIWQLSETKRFSNAQSAFFFKADLKIATEQFISSSTTAAFIPTFYHIWFDRKRAQSSTKMTFFAEIGTRLLDLLQNGVFAVTYNKPAARVDKTGSLAVAICKN